MLPDLLAHSFHRRSIVVRDLVKTLSSLSFSRVRSCTSGWNFFGELRRLRSGAFPHHVKLLIAEKRNGYGHGRVRDGTPGDLAVSCPASPRPGMILPVDYQSEFKPSMTPAVCLDGNSRLVLVQEPDSGNDMSLTNSRMYFIEDAAYKEDLRF